MPTQMEVTARLGKAEGAPSATAYVQTAETAKEAIELFGDEAVVSNANANWRITLQGAIRRYLKAGKTSKEIQELLKSAKMGVTLERVSDPKAALLAKWGTMSEAERQELLAALKKAA